MPNAEIISIGTEILLGEIVDTNASYIARKLRDNGIDLFRKTTIGDNAQRIAQAIQEALPRSDIIITTGGLGPTIDDATREGIALALNVDTLFHDELWQQIQDRFKLFNRIPTENNKRQAFLPEGAVAIENPVGTAPSFYIEKDGKTIISLPGVPLEMSHLLDNAVVPHLQKSLHIKSIIKTRILHTAGVGESQIDHLISDLEKLNNPTIGLAAHSGQVDVRIAAKAESEELADQLIQEIEKELRQRLGKWIYGIDQNTLELAALKACKANGWTLAVIESGLHGELIKRLSRASHEDGNDLKNHFWGGEAFQKAPPSEKLQSILESYRNLHQVDICFGIIIQQKEEGITIEMSIITPEAKKNLSRPYSGPRENAPNYALNQSLNIIKNIRSANNE
jgi:nicotinamide-nucleotide amidase